MPGLEDYDVVKRLHEGTEGNTVLQVRRKSAPGSRFVVRRFTPPVQRLGAARFKRVVELFFEAALTQKVVAEKSAYWAPIHDVRQMESGAYLESDYYPKSVDWLVDSSVRLRSNDLHRVVDSVVKALVDLSTEKGRGHGNITPTRILLKGSGRVCKRSVVLNDPLPDSSVPDDATALDLFQLGRIIHKLAKGTWFEAGKTPYPVELPTRLGSSRKWARICNQLLDPVPANRPRLEALQELLDKIKPTPWRKLMVTATLIGVLAVGGIFAWPHVNKWIHRHDEAFPAQWGRLVDRYPLWVRSTRTLKDPAAFKMLKDSQDPAVTELLDNLPDPRWDPQKLGETDLIVGDGFKTDKEILGKAGGHATEVTEAVRHVDAFDKALRVDIANSKLMTELRSDAVGSPALQQQIDAARQTLEEIADNPRFDLQKGQDVYGVLRYLLQLRDQLRPLIEERQQIQQIAQHLETQAGGFGLGRIGTLAAAELDRMQKDGPAAVKHHMDDWLTTATALGDFIDQNWARIDRTRLLRKVSGSVLNDAQDHDTFTGWIKLAKSCRKIDPNDDPRKNWSPDTELTKLAGPCSIDAALESRRGTLLAQFNGLQGQPFNLDTFDDIQQQCQQIKTGIAELTRDADAQNIKRNQDAGAWKQEILNRTSYCGNSKIDHAFHAWLAAVLKDANDAAAVRTRVQSVADVIGGLQLTPKDPQLPPEWLANWHEVRDGLVDEQASIFIERKPFNLEENPPPQTSIDRAAKLAWQLQDSVKLKLAQAKSYMMAAQMAEQMLGNLQGIDSVMQGLPGTPQTVADWWITPLPSQNMGAHVKAVRDWISKLNELNLHPKAGDLLDQVLQGPRDPQNSPQDRSILWQGWNTVHPTQFDEFAKVEQLRPLVKQAIFSVPTANREAFQPRAKELWLTYLGMVREAAQVAQIVRAEQDFGVTDDQITDPRSIFNVALYRLKTVLSQPLVNEDLVRKGMAAFVNALGVHADSLHGAARETVDKVNALLLAKPEDLQGNCVLAPSLGTELSDLHWEAVANKDLSVITCKWKSSRDPRDAQMHFLRQSLSATESPGEFYLAEDDVTFQLFADVLEVENKAAASAVAGQKTWLNVNIHPGSRKPLIPNFNDSGICVWQLPLPDAKNPNQPQTLRPELRRNDWFDSSLSDAAPPYYYKTLPAGPQATHPMTFVTATGAREFCKLLHCRLPTVREWTSLTDPMAAHVPPSVLKEANLRDKTFQDQVQFINMKGWSNPTYPDRGTCFADETDTAVWSDDLMGPAGNPLNDGFLWFHPAVADGAMLHHLIGNVWKYVVDTDDKDTICLIGGSAMSPVNRGWHNKQPMPSGSKGSSFADVGFRLACDPPKKMLTLSQELIDHTDYLPPSR